MAKSRRFDTLRRRFLLLVVWRRHGSCCCRWCTIEKRRCVVAWLCVFVWGVVGYFLFCFSNVFHLRRMP